MKNEMCARERERERAKKKAKSVTFKQKKTTEMKQTHDYTQPATIYVYRFRS